MHACGCTCCISAPDGNDSVDEPGVDRLSIKDGDIGSFSDDSFCASKDGFKRRDFVDDTYASLSLISYVAVVTSRTSVLAIAAVVNISTITV